MKNLIVVLFALIIIFLSVFSGNVNANSIISNSATTVYTEIDHIEFELIDGQWYMITYYTDGTIGVQPVARPVLD